MRRKRCKDCKAEGVTTDRPAGSAEGGSLKGSSATPRPAPHPGPRCATHHREEKTRKRHAAFGRRLWAMYKLTADQYDKIFELQGGCCYMCQRAKGIRRKLAVDHDHACCPETPTCGRCTRGLLCGTCNKHTGHFRDDPAAFRRGAHYLENPPARQVLGVADAA